jgi:predicted phosphodiesterase
VCERVWARTLALADMASATPLRERRVRLAVASDTRVEFGDKHVKWSCPDTDALLLAGDIGVVAGSSASWARAIAAAAAVHSHVYVVAGNHEHYRSELGTVVPSMRAQAPPNVTVLDREVAWLPGGIPLLGCTLWSNVAATPEALECVRSGMMDYALIRTGGRLFEPEDALALHVRDVSWLTDTLAELRARGAPPAVVLTHHGPLLELNHPAFASGPSSAGFVSDLSALMDPAAVQLWVSGHTHARADLRCRGVRCVAWCCGYPRERAPLVGALAPAASDADEDAARGPAPSIAYAPPAREAPFAPLAVEVVGRTEEGRGAGAGEAVTA